MNFVDLATRQAVLNAFAERLVELPPRGLDPFMACFDLKKKGKNEQLRKRNVESDLAFEVVSLREDEIKEEDDVDVEIVDNKPKKLRKELSIQESSFLDTIGKVCAKTTPKRSSLEGAQQHTQHTQQQPVRGSARENGNVLIKKSRKETLEELAEMEKRVTTLLEEIDCESDFSSESSN